VDNWESIQVEHWESIQVEHWDAQKNAFNTGLHYGLCRRETNRGYQLFLLLLKLDETAVRI
jgi:hypothetical protein